MLGFTRDLKNLHFHNYSTVIKQRSPGQFLARFYQNLLRILKNIRDKSFLEFHLGQKLRKLLIADFEQIWDFFPLFLFLTVFGRPGTIS